MARLSARSVFPVVLFTVIAFVAAALVIGIIYFVAHRSDQVRRDDAREIAEQQLKDDQAAAVSESEANSTATQATTTQQSGEESATAAVQTELPTTGPGDAVGQIVILALLTLAITYFIQSKRVTAPVHL